MMDNSVHIPFMSVVCGDPDGEGIGRVGEERGYYQKKDSCEELHQSCAAETLLPFFVEIVGDGLVGWMSGMSLLLVEEPC